MKPAATILATATLTMSLADAQEPAQQEEVQVINDHLHSPASWMMRVQGADGSYAGANGRPSLAATSLCMLAMLGDGSTLRSGPYRTALKKAIRWVQTRQDENGLFAGEAATATRDHAIATYAMIEAIGQSKSRGTLRASGERALAALARVRHPDGGWTVNPATPFTDARSTGWSTLAMLSGAEFGLEAATIQNALTWFDEQRQATPVDHAIAICCSLSAGRDPRKHPGISESADIVIEHAVPTDPEQAFWTTYGLFRLGGPRWKRWQHKIEATVLPQQITDPEDDSYSSWPPAPPFGRERTTALQLLTLSVYYRFSCLVR